MGNNPVQFATALGTLAGAVDGSNRTFTFNQFPATFLYSVPVAAAGEFVFRNGVFLDSPGDYQDSAGSITFAQVSSGDICTLRIYQGGGPTRYYPGRGLSVVGGQYVQINTQPGRLIALPFMLFRNGNLLTKNLDYTVSGPLVSLATEQILEPDDILIMVTSMGGSPCTTLDGSLYGLVNGFNATFLLPFASSTTLLFRNGQGLTQGADYVQNGAAITMLGAQIPQTGDILTAQIWSTGGPSAQVTTADGTLYSATSVKTLAFLNGLLETQPRDVISIGNEVVFTVAPSRGAKAEVEAWTPDATDSFSPPLNPPSQFSSADGSLIGALNGSNNIFTVNTGALVTDVLVFLTGAFMVFGRDFTWTCLQNSSAGPWITTITMMNGNYPQAGDTLTAEVFLN